MPTMTSSEPSYTGTRECKCSRSAGRISAAGVSTSRQTMSGRGTMTDRTRVSSSSNTLWIISRSSRSTTPSLAPTSTSVLSSSSLSITCSTRSRPMSPTVSAVSPARAARTGVRSTPSHATGRPAKARNRSGYLTASVIGRTSPKVVRTKINTTISTNTPQLGPKRPSAIAAAITAAPMMMTGRPGRGGAAGVGVPDPVGGGRHLAHGAEPRPGGTREALGQALDRLGRAGEEQLVILAATGGPGQRLAIERPRDRVHRGVHGEPSELHTRTEPALLAQVAEVGRETVGEIDHRRDPAGRGEPLSLPGPWPGPQVRGRHVGRCGGSHAARRRGRLEERKSGRGAPERPRDGDHVPGARRGPGERCPGRLAEQRHVDDPAPGRCCGVPADDRHVVLRRERLDAPVEGLGLVETNGLRTGERDQRPPGPAAHRSDIGEVHRE